VYGYGYRFAVYVHGSPLPNDGFTECLLSPRAPPDNVTRPA